MQNMNKNKLNKTFIHIGLILIIFLLVILLTSATLDTTIEPTTIYHLNEDVTIITEMVVTDKNHLEDALNAGWRTETPIKMYNRLGEQIFAYPDQIEFYKGYGWELEPFVTLYASDGRTEQIVQSKIQEQLTVGWYLTYEEAHPERLVYDAFTKSNLSINQLNNILSNTAIKGYGESFYWLEHNHNINALFAISIAVIESGAGTSYNARKRNNLFGIGPHKVFNSYNDCIDYLGRLLNKTSYRGKSIDTIGRIYCTDGTNWAGKVKNHMGVLWNKR